MRRIAAAMAVLVGIVLALPEQAEFLVISVRAFGNAGIDKLGP